MLLSICIPSYNYGLYLPEAIESCLNSKYDFELIVLDNYSTDNTPELKKIYISDSRVKWHRNNELLAIQDNWNKSVTLANGKYIKVLQADDILLPDFFEIFENAISTYPEQGIYGHLAYIIDEKSVKRRMQTPYSDRDELIIVNGADAIKLKFKNIARFKEPSCNFFLKSAFVEVNGYSKEYRFTFDININTLLAFKYGGVLINKYGSCVRRHNKSDGATLPMDLAVGDLIMRNNYFISLLGNKANKSDIRHSNSQIQYRILELFFQRVKSNLIVGLKFLFRYVKYIIIIQSWDITFKTIVRKFKTGDVQATFQLSKHDN
jgi:glycosyltransferase involved in cell wall biosynthesis